MALWVPGPQSDAPFATSQFVLVFQIFFIFPQTFLACSHAHIIDRFNIRIAMFVEPLTEPLPEQKKCVFNFSSFRESDPIVHLRSLFKPMDMAHILNKQFYSSEAKVLLINFNYSAESVVSHDLQAHNKLHCVTLWACRSAIYLVLTRMYAHIHMHTHTYTCILTCTHARTHTHSHLHMIGRSNSKTSPIPMIFRSNSIGSSIP